MKERHEIQLDYDEAKRRADELDELADRVKRIAAREMEAVMDGTAAGWKGKNGTLYNRKNRKFQEEVESLEKKFRRMANTIRFIARTTYDAEMEAVRIAEMMRNKVIKGHSSGGHSF